MSDPQLLHVQQLLAQESDEEAAEVLASVVHPMSAIWLAHLQQGGRERLLLQESIALHAEDPRIQAAHQRLMADDLSGATEILRGVDHPMTEIWIQHLEAGGRNRLLADEQPMAEPLPQPPVAAAPRGIDARMRRILELQSNNLPAAIAAQPSAQSTDPLLTLTPPTRHGMRAISGYWRTATWRDRGVVLFGGAVVFFVWLLFPPPLRGLTLLWLMVLLVAIRFAQVTTHLFTDAQGQLVWEEQSNFRGCRLWTFRLLHTERVQYAGPAYQHPTHPAQALALLVQPNTPTLGLPDSVLAYTIIKLTLLSLWATQRIAVYQQEPQIDLFGMRLKRRRRFIMRPLAMSSTNLAIEERIWTALAVTPTVGRRVEKVANELLQSPRDIVLKGQQDAISSHTAKRGLVRRRLVFDSTSPTVYTDTLQLIALHANTMIYHSEFYRALTDATARAAKVLPVHGYLAPQ